MMRNSSRSVLSRLFLACSNRCPPTTRRFFFSESSGHIIGVPPPPPPLTSRRPAQLSRWLQALRKVVVATTLTATAVYAAARFKYGETVPFTGRTHLALVSHQRTRERGEASFAKFKKEHATKILGPNHNDTIRVRRILDEIIRASHRGVALMQTKASRCPPEGLQWMNRLDWEVIVVRDKKINAECYPGAGKIVVYSGSLHHFGKDAEIAATLAHEVGHVIGRHTSGIYYWLLHILEDMPTLLLHKSLFQVPLVLPFKRRRELEADHIGIMLLAAAGVDPHIAVQVRQRKVETERDKSLKEYLKSTHPTSRKRCRYLSQSKVLGEALKLYKQVTSHGVEC